MSVTISNIHFKVEFPLLYERNSYIEIFNFFYFDKNPVIKVKNLFHTLFENCKFYTISNRRKRRKIPEWNHLFPKTITYAKNK